MLAEQGAQLRQGDLTTVKAFPRWTNDSAFFTPPGAIPGRGSDLLAVLAKTKLMEYRDGVLACVCSHDCDLENPRDRTAILLAPVGIVPQQHYQYEGIRASRAPDADGLYHHLTLYPYEVGLPGNDELVVCAADFSAITALHPAEQVLDALQRNRIWELDEIERREFKFKIAHFFARENEARRANSD
jgi:hypothetical protein